MKNLAILSVVFLYIFIVDASSQEKNIDYKLIAVDDSVTLKQVKILDEHLSVYLLQILDEQKDCRDLEEYVYVVQFSKQSSDSVLMQISLKPPIVLKIDNLVFFEIRGRLFVIRGNFPNTFFALTETSKIIHYKERKIVKDNIMFSLYSRPEQFYTWYLMLKYENAENCIGLEPKLSDRIDNKFNY